MGDYQAGFALLVVGLLWVVVNTRAGVTWIKLVTIVFGLGFMVAGSALVAQVALS